MKRKQRQNTNLILISILALIAVLFVASVVTTGFGWAVFPGGADSGTPIPGPDPTPMCSDSDGGIDPFIKGTVKYFGPPSASFTDYCISDTAVKEFYCEYNMPKNQNIDCAMYGMVCDGGACVPGNNETNTTNCTDTDGGNNHFLKGTVTYWEDGIPYYYTDSCASDNVFLIEFYCDGSSPSHIIINCKVYYDMICFDGACVEIECMDDSDCPGDNNFCCGTLPNTECIESCINDNDCPVGQYCNPGPDGDPSTPCDNYCE